MDYTFTLADVAVIVIVCTIAAILITYMATDDGPPVPVEFTYRLGKNATRIKWCSNSGIHEIMVLMERTADKRPMVGDTVHFIEEGGERFRAKVLDVPYVVHFSGKRQQVLLAVKPVIRG